MQTYQPRQVDSEAPWRWARQSLQLMARRPATYAVASLSVIALFFLALQVESLALKFALVLFLPPLSVVGFLRLAQAADRGEPFIATELLPGNMESLRVLAVAVTGYCIIFAPLVLLSAGAEALADEGVLGWQAQWEAGAADAAASMGISLSILVQALLLGASLGAFAGLLLGMGAWFALPLAGFNGMRLVPACLLSLQASRLNARQLRFSSFFVLIGVLLALVVSFGLLALVLAPFFGAVLYVSYRDVFLGRQENAPVAAASSAALQAG